MGTDKTGPQDNQSSDERVDAMKKRRRKNSMFAVAKRQFLRRKTAIIGSIFIILIVAMCFSESWLTPYNYAEQNIAEKFADISIKHIFGTDQFGRDLFTRLLKGGQLSLVIATASVLMSTVAGVTLGASAAYFGGLYEMIVMRIVDVLMSIPGLLLAASVSTALGTGVYKSMIAIAFGQLANMTRVSYANTLSVRSQEFIEAARARGASKSRIMFKYIIPNSLAPIIVHATLRLGNGISQIASLSFFGLGVQPPTPEWGSIMNQGRLFIRQYWPTVVFPGVMIAITMISWNLIGDGLRDALDPRLKR